MNSENKIVNKMTVHYFIVILVTINERSIELGCLCYSHIEINYYRISYFHVYKFASLPFAFPAAFYYAMTEWLSELLSCQIP